MGKPNKRHHDLCQQYKQSGRREINKAERAERNKRRIAKFAKKRAEKEPKDCVPKSEDKCGTNQTPPLGDFAYRPKMDHMLPYAKEVSFGRRLQNQVDKEEYVIKHGGEPDKKKKK